MRTREKRSQCYTRIIAVILAALITLSNFATAIAVDGSTGADNQVDSSVVSTQETTDESEPNIDSTETTATDNEDNAADNADNKIEENTEENKEASEPSEKEEEAFVVEESVDNKPDNDKTDSKTDEKDTSDKPILIEKKIVEEEIIRSDAKNGVAATDVASVTDESTGEIQGYATVQAAVSAANSISGDVTITILKDFTGSSALKKADRFDFNSKANKASSTITIQSSSGNKFTVQKNDSTNWTNSVIRGRNIVLKDIIIDGGKSNNNRSATTGGGVQVQDGGSFLMNNATIKNCRVNGNTDGTNNSPDGGAIWGNANSTITLTNNSSLENNEAMWDGGAIYAGHVIIEDSTITGNVSGYNAGNTNSGAHNGDGGGIYVLSSLVIKGTSEISGNTAAGVGGGILIANNATGEARISGETEITGNTAHVNGGGIYSNTNTSNGKIFVQDKVQITGNTEGTSAAATNSNIYLAGDSNANRLYVSGNLVSPASIGVTLDGVTAEGGKAFANIENGASYAGVNLIFSDQNNELTGQESGGSITWSQIDDPIDNPGNGIIVEKKAVGGNSTDRFNFILRLNNGSLTEHVDGLTPVGKLFESVGFKPGGVNTFSNGYKIILQNQFGGFEDPFNSGISFSKKDGNFALGDKPNYNDWTVSSNHFTSEVIDLHCSDDYIATIAFADGSILKVPVAAPMGTHTNGLSWSGYEFANAWIEEGVIDYWEFTLSDGESKTFANIENGATYTVTELAVEGWNLESVKKTVGGTTTDGDVANRRAEGTIGQEEQTIVFSNKKAVDNSIIVYKETVDNDEGEFRFLVETDQFVDLSASLDPLDGAYIDSGYNVIGVKPLGAGPNYDAVGGLAIGQASNVGVYTGPKWGFMLHIGELKTNGSVNMPFLYNDDYGIKIIKPSGDYQLGDKPDNTWTFSAPAFWANAKAIHISTDDRYISTVILDNGETLRVAIPSPQGSHTSPEDYGNTWTQTSSLGPVEFVYDDLEESTITGWTFTLRNGEHKELTDLPAGYTYTITEKLTQAQKADGWALIDVSNGSVHTGFTHTMVKDGAQTTFTNKKFPKPNVLYISKETEDSDTEEFDFSLEFPDPTQLDLTDKGMTALDYYNSGDTWNVSPHPMTKINDTQYRVSYPSMNIDDLFTFTAPHTIQPGELPDNTWTVSAYSGIFNSGSGVNFTGDVLGTDSDGYTWIMLNNGEALAIPLNDQNGLCYWGSVKTWGFKLKNGETVSVEDIPDDVEYIVNEVLTTEQIENGWVLESIDGDSDKQSVHEVFGSALKEHVFKNKNTNTPEKGTLTVTKNATGGDGTEIFNFKLEVDSQINMSKNGNLGMVPLTYAEGSPANLKAYSAGTSGKSIKIDLAAIEEAKYYGIYFTPKDGSAWNRIDLPDNNWEIDYDINVNSPMWFNKADVVDIQSDEEKNITYVTVKNGETYAFPMPYSSSPGGARVIYPDASDDVRMVTTYPTSWTFTLRSGETKVISGIGKETKYTVTELPTEGWTLESIDKVPADGSITTSVVNDTTTAGTATGTMATAGHEVTFNNTYAAPNDYSIIKVTKETEIESEDEFVFAIRISGSQDLTDQGLAYWYGLGYGDYAEGDYIDYSLEGTNPNTHTVRDLTGRTSNHSNGEYIDGFALGLSGPNGGGTITFIKNDSPWVISDVINIEDWTITIDVAEGGLLYGKSVVGIEQINSQDPCDKYRYYLTLDDGTVIDVSCPGEDETYWDTRGFIRDNNGARCGIDYRGAGISGIRVEPWLFKLKNGETKEIRVKPGTKYEVWEVLGGTIISHQVPGVGTEYDYQFNIDNSRKWENVDLSGDIGDSKEIVNGAYKTSGSIAAGKTKEFIFTNAVPKEKLIITKKAIGGEGTEEFGFVLTQHNADEDFSSAGATKYSYWNDEVPSSSHIDTPFDDPIVYHMSNAEEHINAETGAIDGFVVTVVDLNNSDSWWSSDPRYLGTISFVDPDGSFEAFTDYGNGTFGDKDIGDITKDWVSLGGEVFQGISIVDVRYTEYAGSYVLMLTLSDGRVLCMCLPWLHQEPIEPLYILKDNRGSNAYPDRDFCWNESERGISLHNGMWKFILKDGESIELSVPRGFEYTVEEVGRYYREQDYAGSGSISAWFGWDFGRWYLDSIEVKRGTSTEVIDDASYVSGTMSGQGASPTEIVFTNKCGIEFTIETRERPWAKVGKDTDIENLALDSPVEPTVLAGAIYTLTPLDDEGQPITGSEIVSAPTDASGKTTLFAKAGTYILEETTYPVIAADPNDPNATDTAYTGYGKTKWKVTVTESGGGYSVSITDEDGNEAWTRGTEFNEWYWTATERTKGDPNDPTDEGTWEGFWEADANTILVYNIYDEAGIVPSGLRGTDKLTSKELLMMLFAINAIALWFIVVLKRRRLNIMMRYGPPNDPLPPGGDAGG